MTCRERWLSAVSNSEETTSVQGPSFHRAFTKSWVSSCNSLAIPQSIKLSSAPESEDTELPRSCHGCGGNSPPRISTLDRLRQGEMPFHNRSSTPLASVVTSPLGSAGSGRAAWGLPLFLREVEVEGKAVNCAPTADYILGND